MLRGGDCAITSVNLAETLDATVRVLGQAPEVMEARLVPLLATRLPVLAVHEAEARRAARLRRDHSHRGRSPLSLADCLLLAAAQIGHATIATSDPSLASGARSEGVGLVSLPGSSGRRP